MCVTVVSVAARPLENLGTYSCILLYLLGLSGPNQQSDDHVSSEKSTCSFCLSPGKQAGKGAHAVFVELPYTPQMQCLCFFCYICSTLCSFWGLCLSQSDTHTPKVMCQLCVTLFALLASCYSFVLREGAVRFGARHSR